MKEWVEASLKYKHLVKNFDTLLEEQTLEGWRMEALVNQREKMNKTLAATMLAVTELVATA